MRPRFLAFWLSGFALGLASCSPHTAPAPTESKAAEIVQNANKRPVLIDAGLDVVPEIAKAGEPWNVAPVSGLNNYTGGSIRLSRRTVFLPGAVILVDRTDDGGVAYVRAQAGISNRCGSAAAVGAAYAELVRALNLALPDASTLTRLKSAWASKSSAIDQFEFGGARFTASGGCLPAIAIKAI